MYFFLDHLLAMLTMDCKIACECLPGIGTSETPPSMLREKNPPQELEIKSAASGRECFAMKTFFSHSG